MSSPAASYLAVLSALAVACAPAARPHSPPREATSPALDESASSTVVEPCRSPEGRLLDTLYSAAVPQVEVAQGERKPDYAATRPWFSDPQGIRFRDSLYLNFGLQRMFAGPALPQHDTAQIIRIGSYQDVPVFARRGEASHTTPDLLFIPAGPICLFQPFNLRSKMYIDDE